MHMRRAKTLEYCFAFQDNTPQSYITALQGGKMKIKSLHNNQPLNYYQMNFSFMNKTSFVSWTLVVLIVAFAGYKYYQYKHNGADAEAVEA